MWNVLLDKFPTEYEGFRIDEAFQTGIQISQALQDPDLSDDERLAVALGLLYPSEDGDGSPSSLPDLKTAVDGLRWFLSGWYTDNRPKDEDKVPVTDFDIDQWRIYSAFLEKYGIDLNRSDMHYWAFMGLLSTLGECAYTNVIAIRQQKIDPKMDTRAKQALQEQKQIFAIEREEKLTEEEQEDVDAFMKWIKVGG